MTGKNRVHVNAKKHFNASMFETTRIAWSSGQKQRHSSDKQTNEQTESSMWSNRQIIETPSVDTLVTTSCLTPLPLSSLPVGNILHHVVKDIFLYLKSDVLNPDNVIF